MWSDAARRSKWVEKEWTNADALDRTIIPCLLDRVSLPGILASKVYVDFRDFEKGMAELLNTLELAQSPTTTILTDVPAQVARITTQLPFTLSLRNRPAALTPDQVKAMLQRYDFYCHDYDWNKAWCNPQGKGIDNDFELQQNGLAVFDHATGLIWQQSGSTEYFTYDKAEEFIRELKNKNFAGYNDWRLPTLEEAMSLMEPKKHGDLYLDPIFDQAQTWIWTADKESASAAWVVDFYHGDCNGSDVNHLYYVRAVRGGQSNI